MRPGLFTDTSDSDFPGIYAQGDLFLGPAPNPLTHPHLQLEKTMVSVPAVRPGDMVFWHCVRTSLVVRHRRVHVRYTYIVVDCL